MHVHKVSHPPLQNLLQHSLTFVFVITPYRRELIDSNPCDRIEWDGDEYSNKFVTSAGIRERTYTEKEMDLLWDHEQSVITKRPTFLTPYAMLFQTQLGLRRVEVCALHWDDITTDENGNEVAVVKNGDEVVEATVTQTDSNGNKIETVVSYENGKPVKQIKKQNGNVSSVTKFTYNEPTENMPFQSGRQTFPDAIQASQKIPYGHQRRYGQSNAQNPKPHQK